MESQPVFTIHEFPLRELYSFCKALQTVGLTVLLPEETGKSELTIEGTVVFVVFVVSVGVGVVLVSVVSVVSVGVKVALVSVEELSAVGEVSATVEVGTVVSIVVVMIVVVSSPSSELSSSWAILIKLIRLISMKEARSVYRTQWLSNSIRRIVK